MIIKSDNRELQTMLFRLEKLLVDNGAWFHHDLSLVCKDNSISIGVEAQHIPKELIIKMPTDLLVPIEPLNLSIKNGNFIINPDEDQLSPVQIELGKLMFDAYNVTNRINLHQESYPWLSFRGHTDLMDTLLKTRADNDVVKTKRDILHDLNDSETMEEIICKTFLYTRMFWHQKSKDQKGHYKIMPMIDYINHDHRGAFYAISLLTDNDDPKDDDFDEKQYIAIKNSQPFMTNCNCYVTYGTYDTIDIFLNYGLINDAAPFIRSIPLIIPIRDTDGIILNSEIGLYRDKVPKGLSDLKRMMPIIGKQPDFNGRILSHLFIPSLQSPHSMRRILRTIIRSILGKSASNKSVIDRVVEAEHFIVEKNITFYKDFIKQIEEDKKTPDDLKEQMHHIAYTQLSKLYKYAYDDDYFVSKRQKEAEGDNNSVEKAVN